MRPRACVRRSLQTRISLSPRSSAMARRNPGHWPVMKGPVSSTHPRRRGAPILHSTATRSVADDARSLAATTTLPEPAARQRLPGSLCGGRRPSRVHQSLAATLDRYYERIRAIQKKPAGVSLSGHAGQPSCCAPKGWTGPKVVGDQPVEGPSARTRCRSRTCSGPDQLAQLEEWMRLPPRTSCSTRWQVRRRSGRPGAVGRPPQTPTRTRTAAHCWSTGIPDFAIMRSRSGISADGASPRAAWEDAARHLHAQRRAQNFRLFCPDETSSNRLGNVFGSKTAVSSDERSISTIICRPMAASWRC